MTEISEGKLTIAFSSANWQVKKYDECDTYVQHLGKTDNLKAIDIIGIHNDDKVYFFEFKDYNGYEGENLNKWNYNINELTVLLSQKIKDSLLGIFSTKRSINTKSDFWDSIVLKFNNNNELRVIFWIDGDLSKYSPNFRLVQLESNLKRKLRCLNSKIIVTNRIKANLKDAIHNYIE